MCDDIISCNLITTEMMISNTRGLPGKSVLNVQNQLGNKLYTWYGPLMHPCSLVGNTFRYAYTPSYTMAYVKASR